MFRRSKTAEAPSPSASTLKEGGKGRPTPTRREAQAAAKARAKGPTDKKGAAALQRQRRGEANARMREAMRTGDDRYLPTRDKGPVRRFARDFVDARICVAELLLPMLLVMTVVGAVAPNFVGVLWTLTILLVALDTLLLVFRLRGQLSARFTDRSTKGAVGYAVLRSLQLRFLRMPKTQVKLGTKLPARY